VPFAAAVSTHPLAAVATGEVTGQLLDQVGAHPDLVCCFVTPAHGGALEDVAAAVRTVLSPTVVIGCVSDWVLGNSTEVEGGAGIALWAGLTGPVTPLTVPATDRFGSAVVDAISETPFPPRGVVILGDPLTFPVEDWLDRVAARHPGLPVAGGLVTSTVGPGLTAPDRAIAPRGPGRAMLLVDDRVVAGGAVGAIIGPGTTFATVVSQGCRPIGQPLVVTRSEGNVVYELAGVPAFSRLLEIAHDQVPAAEIRLINEGLHLGVVVDETQMEPGPADFLMRPVHGADPSNGAIAVGGQVDVGTTVQFSVRDAQAADQDLHGLLAGRRADGVLMFSCTGRGSRLFGQANHDVEAAGEELGFPPLAGIFAAGEIGPAGAGTHAPGDHHTIALRPHLHTQSAALALFADG